VRTLVTGGAGFIGSHLVHHLLEQGHEVVVIDSFVTGRRLNLTAAATSKCLRIVDADVTNLEAISPHFSGVHWVFHLAALADIVPSIASPLTYHRNNVDGTVCVLEAARLAGVHRFIYAASSSCYGIPDTVPTPETAPIRPQYPYALTKYLGEQYVLHWAQTYRLPALSLRLFNVYGPRSRTSGAYGAVFGVFLAQKLHNQPFTVVGDGSQTRDFTYVRDVVEAMIMAARAGLTGEAMNVGSGMSYSVNQLVKMLGGDTVRIPKRPGEPDCTLADISKIRSLLGWRPRVSFEEGVGIMLDNIEYWRDAPVWTPASIAAATEEWFKHLGYPGPSDLSRVEAQASG